MVIELFLIRVLDDAPRLPAEISSSSKKRKHASDSDSESDDGQRKSNKKHKHRRSSHDHYNSNGRRHRSGSYSSDDSNENRSSHKHRREVRYHKKSWMAHFAYNCIFPVICVFLHFWIKFSQPHFAKLYIHVTSLLCHFNITFIITCINVHVLTIKENQIILFSEIIIKFKDKIKLIFVSCLKLH